MKYQFAMKFFGGLILILTMMSLVLAQKSADDKNVLLPPSEGLVRVRHPDLQNLEAEVREQIVSFQRVLSETAKKSPKNSAELSEVYAVMGRIYHAYSFFEAAAENYSNASRLAPKDFRWRYLLGKAAEAQNKTGEAIEFYKQAEKLRPDYLPIYVSMGNAYLELNLPDAAKGAFENALKKEPNNPAALYGLGQVMYGQQNYADAVRLFEKVLSLVPEANRVNYALALAYRGLKDNEKAKLYLAKQGAVGVRAADPLADSLDDLKKGSRLRLLRGKQALEAGRFAEAEIEFQKALAAEPENVTALVNYGVTLVELKKYPEAVRHFEKAAALDPKNANARYNLAILLSLQKKHFQAISHLKTILEINPKDDASRFLLAKELNLAGLKREALNEFSAVYQTNSDNEDVLLELVTLLTEKGEHRKAKDLLEKSHGKHPARGRTVAALAYLLAASPQTDLRDGKKALELAQALYQTTKQIEHGVIVAMAYAELDQCEPAAKLIKELLEQAEKMKNQALLGKLQTELNRYEKEKPCRVKN